MIYVPLAAEMPCESLVSCRRDKRVVEIFSIDANVCDSQSKQPNLFGSSDL